MKIINRKAFLAMPAGTVFSTYDPSIFGPLTIKEETLPTNDFLEQQIADAIECNGGGDFCDKLDMAQETGASLAMDFYCLGRDGLFEPDDGLFAVWERADVEALIKRLQETLG